MTIRKQITTNQTIVEYCGSTNVTQIFTADSKKKLMQDIERVVTSNQVLTSGSMGVDRRMRGANCQDVIIFWLEKPHAFKDISPFGTKRELEFWQAELTAFPSENKNKEETK